MRIAILVEGQTEESFVNELIVNEFYSKEKIISPIILTSKRTMQGYKYKGGMPPYRNIKKDIKNLLGSFDKVTTMFDYYGISSSFPGFKSQPSGNCYIKVDYLEQELAKDISNINFIPYIQLHEYEGLLFSSISGFEYVFPNRPDEIELIRKIIGAFPNPEIINLGKETAPSKRILSVFPSYEKVFAGTLIAEHIGLPTIKRKCKHFKNWLDKI